MAGKMDEATRKRVRAGRMLSANKPVAEVAAAVGVARQTVYTWKARLDEGGIGRSGPAAGALRDKIPSGIGNEVGLSLVPATSPFRSR
ncbi:MULTISPECIES: helix-turn-helix domain-containing protein [Cupriavidus]|uniref:helix-turn-helix domain-containing protein n=1 Tax=Cupriavidus TaxID=106589 RepID=UPI002159F0DB|nr:helix-turn-helix domain-containing protein [Cupriavidus pinatubonensis]